MKISPHLFFLAGVLPALLINFIGSFFYFVIFADSGFANVLYGSVKLLILVWPLLWLPFVWPLPRFSVAVSRRKSISWGFFSGLLILAAGLFLFFSINEYFLNFAPAVVNKIDQMGIMQFYFAFAIVISLAHSLLEEFYWRFFVFRGLMTHLSVKTAAVVSAIGFSLHHFVILSQYFPIVTTLLLGFGVFIGGVFWCLLYARTGSILGSWISHIAVDAGIFWIGYQIAF